MPGDILVKHCAPTLAGLKSGNLFSCSYESKAKLRMAISGFNQILVPKGLRMVPIRIDKTRALIYVYRVSRIKEDLASQCAQSILEPLGYAVDSPNRCVAHLQKRFHSEETFPHEVGLFLSYPPEDVLGFIENKAQNAKCVGTWKVYGDEEAARKTFAKYKKCTEVYCACWQRGKPIEKLAVAG